MQQRRDHLRRAAEELMHEAVFGTPEADRIEAGGGEEIGRVVAAAMRRGEDQRQGLPLGLDDLVWLRGLGARRDRVHVSTGLGSATVLGQRRGPVMPDSPLGPAAFAGFHCRLPLRYTWGFRSEERRGGTAGVR